MFELGFFIMGAVLSGMAVMIFVKEKVTTTFRVIDNSRVISCEKLLKELMSKHTDYKNRDYYNELLRESDFDEYLKQLNLEPEDCKLFLKDFTKVTNKLAGEIHNNRLRRIQAESELNKNRYDNLKNQFDELLQNGIAEEKSQIEASIKTMLKDTVIPFGVTDNIYNLLKGASGSAVAIDLDNHHKINHQLKPVKYTDPYVKVDF